MSDASATTRADGEEAPAIERSQHASAVESPTSQKNDVGAEPHPAFVRKEIERECVGDATEIAQMQLLFEKLVAFRHPGVEQIHEAHVRSAGACYLMCEPRRGETLDALLSKNGMFKLDEVRAIARQLVDALVAAHDAGIVHGNLSLACIELEPRSEAGSKKPPRVKLRDFGLGRRLAPSLRGALGYLAPEQVDSKALTPDPTPQSDQFALGVILFELLSGWRIFAGTSFSEVRGRLLRQDPPHVQLPDVSAREGGRVIRALHKAMARLPDQRFPSLHELVTALEGGGSRFTAAPGPRPRPSSSDAMLPPEALRVDLLTPGGTQPLIHPFNTSPTLINAAKQTERNQAGRRHELPTTSWLLRIGTAASVIAVLLTLYRCVVISPITPGTDAGPVPPSRPQDMSVIVEDLARPAPIIDASVVDALQDAKSSTHGELSAPNADLSVAADLSVQTTPTLPVQPATPPQPKADKPPKKPNLGGKRGPAKKRHPPAKEVSMDLDCQRVDAECVRQAANRCVPKLSAEDEGASIDFTFIFRPELEVVSLANRSSGPRNFVDCARNVLIDKRLCGAKKSLTGFVRCTVVKRRTSQ